MKYLLALALSGMLFLGMMTQVFDSHFWGKLLHNKETPKDKKKREYKIVMFIWAILTIVLFVYVIFFVD